jgi:hypothetical protein
MPAAAPGIVEMVARLLQRQRANRKPGVRRRSGIARFIGDEAMRTALRRLRSRTGYAAAAKSCILRRV